MGEETAREAFLTLVSQPRPPDLCLLSLSRTTTVVTPEVEPRVSEEICGTIMATSTSGYRSWCSATLCWSRRCHFLSLICACFRFRTNFEIFCACVRVFLFFVLFFGIGFGLVGFRCCLWGRCGFLCCFELEDCDDSTRTNLVFS